jgi:hypothetical protein
MNKATKLLYEQGYKLRAAVRNHLLREAMEFPNIAQVQIGHSSGHDGGDCLDEMRLLAHRVYHYHNGIIPSRFQKFNDEVHAYGLPMAFRDRERLKFSRG